MTRPNVLFVVFDTARADAFEPYGAAPGASPAVGQLAARGTAVPYAVAPANWTVPSHASMFTGLLPRQLRLTQAPAGQPAACRPVLEQQRARFLPEVMRGAGWQTAGVSTNLWVQPSTGFGTGFDDFRLVKGRLAHGWTSGTRRGRLRWALAGARAAVDDGAGAVEDLLRAWVADPDRRPFFWFVNLIECHSPYLPPRPYNDLPVTQRIRAAEEAQRYLNLDAIVAACLGKAVVPVAALARMRHLYARSVRLMDDWLARIMHDLDRHGLLDDTVVIVTSDHGENLGEDGFMGHALSLDERLTRVPFVLAGPGLVPIDAPFSLADVPALVARITALDDHPWGDSQLPAGIAVSQHDGFAAPDDPNIRADADAQGLGPDSVGRLTMSITSATDGTLKLVDRDGSEAFYDLAADPLERRPVGDLALDPARVGRLRAAVAAAAPTEDTVPMWPSAGHATDVGALEEQMRLLGYL